MGLDVLGQHDILRTCLIAHVARLRRSSARLRQIKTDNSLVDSCFGSREVDRWNFERTRPYVSHADTLAVVSSLFRALPYDLRSHQASSQHEQPALKSIINKLRPKHLVDQERSTTEPIGSSSKTKNKRQPTKSVEDDRKGLKTDIVGKAPSLNQREAAAQALQNRRIRVIPIPQHLEKCKKKNKVKSKVES